MHFMLFVSFYGDSNFAFRTLYLYQFVNFVNFSNLSISNYMLTLRDDAANNFGLYQYLIIAECGSRICNPYFRGGFANSASAPCIYEFQ